MERHILTTVSRDPSAQFGLRFICDFFRNKENLKLTLFSTAASPLSLASSAGKGERAASGRVRSKREKECLEALDRAWEYCSSRGFDSDDVQRKMHFHSMTTAMDIIREAERGLYDAVVLGSRGLSWLEEFMANSVSREVLDRRLTIPLWICRRPGPDRNDVLACVDDSEQSFRMIDHVAFILDHETSQNVTLLNVYDPHSGDRIIAEQLFDHCAAILRKGGVAAGRIRRRCVEDYDVPRTILRIAQNDRFAAVALGRTGEDKGLMRRLFMGSVSTELFHQLTGAVLWLSQ